MDIRPGMKSTELYITVAIGLLAKFWPGCPTEALYALGAWVLARGSQKAFGFVDPVTGKRAWATSEFWVAIAFSIIKAVFPDLPDVVFQAALGYIGVRTGTRVLKDFNVPPATIAAPPK